MSNLMQLRDAKVIYLFFLGYLLTELLVVRWLILLSL